ncbi:DUF4834 family protein [Pararhodonellum marinum]|uniref:DUF4834 family protein n=1 Tax=Pararhodonellum marinum TaxID=2755358 RepID=UPI00188F81B4|nr:DUF4834 family protein [Pararhodonellum marinum]
MGFILKFILISIALSWIFSKLLEYFMKSKFKKFVDQMKATQQENQPKRKPADGNVNVDYIPKEHLHKKEIKGGDYIDYEEVKE